MTEILPENELPADGEVDAGQGSEESFEQQLAQIDIATEQRGDDFFTESELGDIAVRPPYENEAIIFGADQTAQRETEVKESIEKGELSGEETLTAARREVVKTEQVLEEATTADKIIDKLRADGKLLVANRSAFESGDVPADGLHFVISKNQAAEIRQAFSDLGFTVDTVGNQAVVANGLFSKYTFIFAGEKLATGHPRPESSIEYDDYDDEQPETNDGLPAAGRRKRGGIKKRKNNLNRLSRTQGTKNVVTRKLKGGTSTSKQTELVQDSELLTELPPIAAPVTPEIPMPPTKESGPILPEIKPATPSPTETTHASPATPGGAPLVAPPSPPIAPPGP